MTIPNGIVLNSSVTNYSRAAKTLGIAPHDMPGTYASLHARIQDAFYEAGVEIMSPHDTSIRDGNTVAIPEPFRGPGYRAPAFRVDDVRRRGDDDGATPRST